MVNLLPSFPADAERWRLSTLLYRLRQRRNFASAIARRGSHQRIFDARRAVLCIVASSGSRGDLTRVVAVAARE